MAPFVSPLDFGAAGDGLALDTAALQAAIDACAAGGGGTILLPPGRYLTGPLFLRDQITLQLEAGATLLGSQNPADYPVITSRWEGVEQPGYAPLLGGSDLTNVTITGRGTIDGQGDCWWQAFRQKSLAYPRPRLIGFSDCRNLLIENVSLAYSPSWTVHPVRCENVTVRGIRITNPPDSPNTDGINPDSCRLVRISDCSVSAGDDCIAIKAGTQQESPPQRAACRDITITNCTFERGHGGVVIGSETNGDIRNVAISNCIFIGTDRGLRMKSRRGRGGVVENVSASNLIMDGVDCPFTMNLYYHCGGAKGDPVVSDKNPRPVDSGTPIFRNIHFNHIVAVQVRIAAGFFYGLAEMPLRDISLSDIFISVASSAEPGYPEMADDIPSISQAGFFIRNACDLRLDHVRITGQIGKDFDLDESVEADIRP